MPAAIPTELQSVTPPLLTVCVTISPTAPAMAPPTAPTATCVKIAPMPYEAVSAGPMPKVSVPIAAPTTIAAMPPQSQPHAELPDGSEKLIGSPIAYSYAFREAVWSGSGCSQRAPSGV